mgnify:CR=1 FL=1
MITCKLGEKTYSVDFISTRALRGMGAAWDAYTRITGTVADAAEGKAVKDAEGFEKELDALVQWFCLLFKNQFTPDEFYDGYPNDRAVHDIVLALLAVRGQTTEVLDTFPTTAAQATAKGEA